MAASVTLKSKKLDPLKRPTIEKSKNEISNIKNLLEKLAEEDAQSFDQVMAAFSVPKENPQRRETIDSALLKAAEVPLKTAQTSQQALRKTNELKNLVQSSVSSDLNCALHLLKAALLCATENVRINLDSLSDKSKAGPAEKALADCLETSL